MKKERFLTFIILFALVSCLSLGQSTVKETRNVRNFTKVSFGVAGNLYINLGSEYKVILEGRSDFLEKVETEVSEGRLVIKMASWRFSIRNERITAYVTMPEIEGLSVSGSGRAEIQDDVITTSLSLNVSGSGKIYTADVEVRELNSRISGSGDIIIDGDGKADNADISISGSGNFTGETIELGDLSASISGSGDCFCNVSESLDARISGSGNITYTGSPRINARVSGSGHVRSR